MWIVSYSSMYPWFLPHPGDTGMPDCVKICEANASRDHVEPGSTRLRSINCSNKAAVQWIRGFNLSACICQSSCTIFYV